MHEFPPGEKRAVLDHSRLVRGFQLGQTSVLADFTNVLALLRVQVEVLSLLAAGA